mgnify:CR=1 FL=1
MAWHKLLPIALMVLGESYFDCQRLALQVEVLDINAEIKHLLSLVVSVDEK